MAVGYGYISGTAEITQAASIPNTGLGYPSYQATGKKNIGILWTDLTQLVFMYMQEYIVIKRWLNAGLLRH